MNPVTAHTSLAHHASATKNASVVTGATTGTGSSDSKTAQLRKAAQDFEAILLRQMLSPLSKATQVSQGSQSVPGQSAFGSMLVDTVADSVAQAGGLGLVDIITRAIEPRLAHGTSSSKDTVQSREPLSDTSLQTRKTE